MQNITRDKFDHDLSYQFCTAYSGIRESGTITGYRVSADGFLTWLKERRGVNLEDIDWTDLDAHVTYLARTYPDSTVKTRYNHLRTFLDWLVHQMDILDSHPADHDAFEIKKYISRGKTRKQEETAARGGIVFITPNEYQQLIENVPSPKFRNELIIKMLYGLGLRRKELVDIKITPEQPDEGRYGHLNFEKNKVEVPAVKSDDGRPLWFGAKLRAPLRRWIRNERDAVFYADRSDYLFPSRNSDQLTPKRVTAAVAQAAENAGIQSVMYTDEDGNERRRITPHACRHGFAVRHVRNGTDVVTLRDLMGHQDVSVTQVYLQFRDATLRDAMHRNSPEL